MECIDAEQISFGQLRRPPTTKGLARTRYSHYAATRQSEIAEYDSCDHYSTYNEQTSRLEAPAMGFTTGLVRPIHFHYLALANCYSSSAASP